MPSGKESNKRKHPRPKANDKQNDDSLKPTKKASLKHSCLQGLSHLRRDPRSKDRIHNEIVKDSQPVGTAHGSISSISPAGLELSTPIIKKQPSKADILVDSPVDGASPDHDGNAPLTQTSGQALDPPATVGTEIPVIEIKSVHTQVTTAINEKAISNPNIPLASRSSIMPNEQESGTDDGITRSSIILTDSGVTPTQVLNAIDRSDFDGEQVEAWSSDDHPVVNSHEEDLAGVDWQSNEPQIPEGSSPGDVSAQLADMAREISPHGSSSLETSLTPFLAFPSSHMQWLAEKGLSTAEEGRAFVGYVNAWLFRALTATRLEGLMLNLTIHVTIESIPAISRRPYSLAKLVKQYWFTDWAVEVAFIRIFESYIEGKSTDRKILSAGETGDRMLHEPEAELDIPIKGKSHPPLITISSPSQGDEESPKNVVAAAPLASTATTDTSIPYQDAKSHLGKLSQALPPSSENSGSQVDGASFFTAEAPTDLTPDTIHSLDAKHAESVRIDMRREEKRLPPPRQSISPNSSDKLNQMSRRSSEIEPFACKVPGCKRKFKHVVELSIHMEIKHDGGNCKTDQSTLVDPFKRPQLETSDPVYQDDKELQNSEIPAPQTTGRQNKSTNEGFRSYQGAEAAKFFVPGRMIAVAQYEDTLSSIQVDSLEGSCSSLPVFNNTRRLSSDFRRLIVVRVEKGYCHAIPIQMIGTPRANPAVAERRRKHLITYGGNESSAVITKESSSRGKVIPIEMDDGETLECMSRLDLDQPQIVRWTDEVKKLGMITASWDVERLQQYYDNSLQRGAANIDRGNIDHSTEDQKKPGAGLEQLSPNTPEKEQRPNSWIRVDLPEQDNGLSEPLMEEVLV